MAAITMALVSGALAGGGSFLSTKRAKKNAKRQQRALRKATGEARSVQGTALDQQEAAVRRATQARLGGLASAEKDANRVVRERESQTSAALSQSLANSGLGSTTMGANMQRGVASDASRTLSDLLSQLAQTRGDIQANEASSLGDIARQRGDLFSGLAQQETLGNAALAYSGPSYLEGALGALGTGLGTYSGMKGPGGGGAGRSSLAGQDPMGGFGMQSALEQIYRPYPGNYQGNWAMREG